MVYILFLSILALLVLSFFVNKKDIISPAFIFTFGFFFQSIWVILYSKKWELGLHFNTYFVIVFGVLVFIGITSLVTKLYNKNNEDTSELKYIHIDKWKKIIFLVFSVFATIYYLNFIVTSVGGRLLDFKNITHYISEFDRITKFSTTFIKTPFIVGNLKTLVIASGLWFMYVLINNYIYNKKIDLYNAAIIIVSLLLSVLNGSRTLFFFMIVAGIEYLIMITKSGNNNQFNSKLIVKIGLVGIAFLLLFASFAKILGREIKTNSVDYLAIYCGAEVKNLDMFLQENVEKNTKYFGTQTFQPIITTIGRKIGFNGYEDYKLDLPFRSVGNYSLGNVYTTFYPYVYDFGYIGLLFLVPLMAFISQIIYELAKKKASDEFPSVWNVAYGLVFACLLLSFFSNKFYETIFTMDFIKRIIIWYLCTIFFCKLNFKKIRTK